MGRCLLRVPGPLLLVELARDVHRDPSSVSVLAQRLAERRLLREQRDPYDRRPLRFVATPEGRCAVREAPAVTRAALASVVATWPAERVRAATDLLTGLATALPTQR